MNGHFDLQIIFIVGIILLKQRRGRWNLIASRCKDCFVPFDCLCRESPLDSQARRLRRL
jgi:hypothetical protein